MESDPPVPLGDLDPTLGHVVSRGSDPRAHLKTRNPSSDDSICCAASESPIGAICLFDASDPLILSCYSLILATDIM
jgi:hypothetical protein